MSDALNCFFCQCAVGSVDELTLFPVTPFTIEERRLGDDTSIYLPCRCHFTQEVLQSGTVLVDSIPMPDTCAACPTCTALIHTEDVVSLINRACSPGKANGSSHSKAWFLARHAGYWLHRPGTVPALLTESFRVGKHDEALAVFEALPNLLDPALASHIQCDFCLCRPPEGQLTLFSAAPVSQIVYRDPKGKTPGVVMNACECHCGPEIESCKRRNMQIVERRKLDGDWRACPHCTTAIRTEDPKTLLQRMSDEVDSSDVSVLKGLKEVAGLSHVSYWLHRDEGPLQAVLEKIDQQRREYTDQHRPPPRLPFGRYSAALEQQLDLLHFYRSNTTKHLFEQDRSDDQIRRAVVKVCERATPVYVKPEIGRLLGDAMPELPDLPLSSDELPTDSGFVLFDGYEHSFTKITSKGYCGALSALAWGTRSSLNLDIIGMRPSNQDGVLLFAFGRVWFPGDPPPADNQLQILGVAFWRYGETMEAALNRLQASQNYADWQIDRIPIMLRHATSLWSFMQQRIAVRRQESVDRPLRKRMERDRVPHQPIVEIIELRAKQYTHHPDDGYTLESTPPNWSCRWVVRKHWALRRCGSGRQNVKRVLIDAYIKGPPDRPLKTAQKLFAIVR